MRERDVGWLAGILEGEGYFNITRNQPRQRAWPRILVTMTDQDVIERLAEVTGVGTLRMPKLKPRHQQTYAWSVRKPEEVRTLLRLCLPLFGQRRFERAVMILDYLQDREEMAAVYGVRWFHKITRKRGNQYTWRKEAAL